MSEMGQLAMELDEQAAELGFESYLKALECGFVVEDGKLCPPEPKSPAESVLDGLDEVIDYFKEQADGAEGGVETHMIDILRNAEKYIKEN